MCCIAGSPYRAVPYLTDAAQVSAEVVWSVPAGTYTAVTPPPVARVLLDSGRNLHRLVVSERASERAFASMLYGHGVHNVCMAYSCMHWRLTHRETLVCGSRCPVSEIPI